MKLISLFEKQDTRTNKTVWGILHTPDKLLLGKRAPGTNNANQWNFFGGHVDKGESNAFMTYQQPKLLEATSKIVTGVAK